MTNPAVIKKPLTSDKATALSKSGKYIFTVARSSTKNEVKKAIKKIYGVDVIAVNVVSQKPKRKRYRGVVTLRGRDKKAIVTVKEGQKIDLGI